MDIEEIIERVKNISRHAIYTPGQMPFIMSLDDGIALCEAAELLERQEPTEAEEHDGTYYCLGCKETILKTDKYCAHCGRPINWHNGNDEDET